MTCTNIEFKKCVYIPYEQMINILKFRQLLKYKDYSQVWGGGCVFNIRCLDHSASEPVNYVESELVNTLELVYIIPQTWQVTLDQAGLKRCIELYVIKGSGVM